MNAGEIIGLANEIKEEFKSNNPFELASYLGIQTSVIPMSVKDYKGRIIKVSGLPTIIMINNAYTELSRNVLCAHELGHALLHDDGINQFGGKYNVAWDDTEYEANLFAVALLFDEDDFNMPLEKMSRLTLKMILEHNIHEI